MNPQDIVKGAIGPFDNYCDGYGNPGSSGNGYICAVTLKTGIAKRQSNPASGLDSIIAYDRAETCGAYLGQINMIIASSFCGPTGALWGYDIARHESWKTTNPLWMVERHDGKSICVLDIEPLLDASLRLFGTNEQKRFPLHPGAHVVCAAKWEKFIGPGYLWCTVGLGIAENRELDACVFMEDTGVFNLTSNLEQMMESVLQKTSESVSIIGKNQNILFREILVGYRTARIEEDEIGCALIANPFMVLAKKAVPFSNPGSLVEMNLTEWESVFVS